jgi:hypothetical protein
MSPGISQQNVVSDAVNFRKPFGAAQYQIRYGQHPHIYTRT